MPAEYPAISSIGYVRDGNGNLTEVTERKLVAGGTAEEVTGRVFDALDRLESETRYDGKVVGYGYDAKGNRTRVTDPDGVETTYTYDAQDRVETATAAGRTATYGYWPDGLQRHVALPSGVEEGRCYDAAGRLTELVTARGAVAADCTTAAPVLSRYGYGYDANGNRSTQTERRTDPATQALGASEATEYGYDELDRLTGVGYPDGRVVLYQLDAVGNRTGEREVQTAGGVGLGTYASPPAGTLTRDVAGTFNRADWLLSRTDAVDASRSVGFGYDLAGNQVTRTQGGVERRYAWDGRNTLTAVYEGGVERGRYDYDRNLQRVKRRTASENVEYVLDDRFVLQETDATVLEHPWLRRYHYAARPLAVADAGGFTFLSVDALGSVGDQTTTSGTVAAARQYDAWGQYRNSTAPSSGQPKLGYTGHQFDPESGLVYARARYYDAETGTFLSRDTVEGTIGDAPSLHRFVYVRGNPVRYIDADGQAALDAAEAIEKTRVYRLYLAGLHLAQTIAELPALKAVPLYQQAVMVMGSPAAIVDALKLGKGFSDATSKEGLDKVVPVLEDVVRASTGFNTLAGVAAPFVPKRAGAAGTAGARGTSGETGAPAGEVARGTGAEAAEGAHVRGPTSVTKAVENGTAPGAELVPEPAAGTPGPRSVASEPAVAAPETRSAGAAGADGPAPLRGAGQVAHGRLCEDSRASRNTKLPGSRGFSMIPQREQGSHTSTDIVPVDPDAIRGATGARSADYYLDIDIAGKPRLTTRTKGGYPDIKVQADIRPEDVVGGGRVKKSTFGGGDD